MPTVSNHLIQTIIIMVSISLQHLDASAELSRSLHHVKHLDIDDEMLSFPDSEQDEDDIEEYDYDWLDKPQVSTEHPNSVLPFNKKGYKDYGGGLSTLKWWEKTPLPPRGLDATSSNPIAATTPSPEEGPGKRTEVTDAKRKVELSVGQHHLPQFLSDPKDAFIIRGKSAELSCRVKYADKAYFSCNGEAMAAADRHKEVDHIEMTDGHDVSTVKQLILEISRNQVEEFFGQFSCRCDAWSSKGMSSSRNATVEIAYLRKEFEVPPYSQSVELRSQIELRCHPPKGVPKPRIYWLKDRVEVQPERDPNYIQAADGHLIIIQAREKDRANYTCVAENVANRRLSPPARLNVHVTGGWSEWSEWSDCSSSCGPGSQRRDRVCDNPTPMWGGALCEGPAFQKNKCSTICPDGVYNPETAITAVSGGWSSWSSWSTCNADCVRHRHRECNNPQPANGGPFCKGLDQLVDVCTGGMCREKRQIFDGKVSGEAQEMLETDFSLLVGLSVALTVFLVVTVTSIRILRRKGRSSSMYTMTNLSKKDDNGSLGAGTANSKSLMETTKFGNVMSSSRGRVGATTDNVGIESELLADKKPATLAKFGDYDVVMATTSSVNNSLSGSPFIDKKSSGLKSKYNGLSSHKASLLFSSSPATSVRSSGPQMDGQRSPTCSEHQYDIPFGHLSHKIPASVGVQRRKPPRFQPKHPDYDEMRNLLQKPHPHLNIARTSVTNGESSNAMNKDILNNVWASSSPRLDTGTLLQPRLVDQSAGKWSGSDKSLNTSIYSESDRPVSSLFGGEAEGAICRAAEVNDNVSSYRQSLSSCSLDPDSFTFASINHSGAVVQLMDLGISLTIPEGALERGYTEEIFLAVMTEGRDRPRLCENQTLLSPVVLVGPPRLTFKKPVVLSFGHCANVCSLANWEMGLYHCDSLFSETDETPWVKLKNISPQSTSPSTSSSAQAASNSLTSSSSSSCKTVASSDSCQGNSSVMVHLEKELCFVMTDFLSRFCVVGQTVADANGSVNFSASKMLRLLVFGKPLSSGMDLSLVVQVVDDTATALEAALRSADKQGYGLIRDDEKRTLQFFDSIEVEGDLHLNISDCSTGWSLRPKSQQTLQFAQVWSGSSCLRANYSLRHVDPTVQTIAFKLTTIQGSFPHEQTRATFGVFVDVTQRLLSPLEMKPVSGPTFKLPPGLKMRLCRALDSPRTKGHNDWRALSAGMRLDKFSAFFASRSSPTETILTLWEAIQQSHCAKEKAKPLSDLLHLLRVIGREDAALMIEKDFSPWIQEQ